MSHIAVVVADTALFGIVDFLPSERLRRMYCISLKDGTLPYCTRCFVNFCIIYLVVVCRV